MNLGEDDDRDEEEDLPERNDNQDDAAIEARARAMGWRPENEWDEERAQREGRTKPRRFLTAADYIERTEGSLPILRKTLRTQSDEITKLRGDTSEANRKLDDLGKLLTNLHRTNQAIGKREYERGMADAKAARKAAIETGDEAAVDQADAAMRQLEDMKPEEPEREEETPRRNGAPAPKNGQQGDPVIQSWIGENSWFNTDNVTSAFMLEAYEAVKKQRPSADVRAQLDEAKARVQKRFPERFGLVEEEELEPEPELDPDRGNANRRAPAAVNSSTRSASRRGNGHTFADVPKSDQAEFRRHQEYMKAKGIEYTEAEFLAGYQW